MCPCVWLAQLILVGLGARSGIDLIAAHHEHLATRQFLSSKLKLATCEKKGDCVCAIETISKISDKIEPHGAFCVRDKILLDRGGTLLMFHRLNSIECGDHQSAVSILTE